MKLYISVISHHHEGIIEQIKTLSRLATYPEITVIFRDNVNSKALKAYCKKIGIAYYPNKKKLGFSANNNLNFLLALGMGLSSDDYFLLLNPDVELSDLTIKQLLAFLKKTDLPIMAPNLFLNSSLTIADDSLRQFPTLTTFIANYLFNDRSNVIDKQLPVEPQTFWASGAFLIIKAHIYQSLKGLDENYFLYCEDVDFCFRALKKGIRVSYLPDIKAIHYRRCESRKFGSKPFFYHVKSVFLYELMRLGLRPSWGSE